MKGQTMHHLTSLARSSWIHAAVLLAIVVCVHAPSSDHFWMVDDPLYVGRNPNVQGGAEGLRKIWFTLEENDYLPVTATTFWIEWRFWGEDPGGYHRTNVALHGLCAVLMWVALRRLRIPGAWWAALLFGVHPVTVASAAWIAERKTILAMIFSILALLAYLHGRKWSYGAALALFIVALLSKPVVAMLPAVMLLCLWWLHGRVTRKEAVMFMPFFAASLLVGMLTIWTQVHHTMANDAVTMPGPVARVAGAGWALWHYAVQAVLPFAVVPCYPGWQPSDIARFTPLGSIGLLVLAGFAWPRRTGWGRPVLFALGAMTALLLPALGFVRAYLLQLSLVWDHWQYPALIVPIALAVALLASRLPRWTPALLLPVAFGFAWSATVHTRVFRDDLAFWTAAIEHDPRCWQGQCNVGAEYLACHDFEKAEIHLAEAVRLKPTYAIAKSNLAIVYLHRGHLDEAQRLATEARDTDPRMKAPYKVLAMIAERRPH